MNETTPKYVTREKITSMIDEINDFRDWLKDFGQVISFILWSVLIYLIDEASGIHSMEYFTQLKTPNGALTWALLIFETIQYLFTLIGIAVFIHNGTEISMKFQIRKEKITKLTEKDIYISFKKESIPNADVIHVVEQAIDV